MMMRTAAPREAQYVSDLGNISADMARSYALAAESEGLSYVGALQNLIMTLSVQAQMESAQTQAGIRLQGAQAAAAAAAETPPDWRMIVLEGLDKGAGLTSILNAVRAGGYPTATIDDINRAISEIGATRAAAAGMVESGTWVPPRNLR
jgi:hypothetical protein